MDISQHSRPDGAVSRGLARARRVLRLLFFTALAFLTVSAIAWAQDATATAGSVEVANPNAVPSAVPPEVLSPQAPEVPGPKISEPEVDPVSKRLFGVIPNYRADQSSDSYQPLTLRQKYKIAREDSFDWPNFPLLVGYALQAQIAAGGFRHNGGMTGFGEYYARGFADQVIGSYVTEAILPGLLHEDPRYFRLGTGHFLHRISYAASRTFVTRGDNGKTRFFASEVLGNAGVAALGSLYYPNSGTLGEIGEHYGMQLGNDAVSNILTEFWPDIRLRLRFVRQRLVTSLFHH